MYWPGGSEAGQGVAGTLTRSWLGIPRHLQSPKPRNPKNSQKKSPETQRRSLGSPDPLAAQKSHRKIAMTTVAASGLATIPLQKSQGFLFQRPQKKPLAASNFLLASKSQEARSDHACKSPQRFRSRSDHGTLSPDPGPPKSSQKSGCCLNRP